MLTKSHHSQSDIKCMESFDLLSDVLVNLPNSFFFLFSSSITGGVGRLTNSLTGELSRLSDGELQFKRRNCNT